MEIFPLSSASDKLISFFTSKSAIYVYVVVLLLIIVVFIIKMIMLEKKSDQALKDQKEKLEKNSQEKIEELIKENKIQQDKMINEKMDSLHYDLFTISQSISDPSIRETLSSKVNEQINLSSRESLTNSSLDSVDPVNKLPEFEEDNQDEVLKEGTSRFYNLTRIDEAMKDYLKPQYVKDMSLKEICEDFRNYCCSELKLYYDIKDIRRFIASLSVTRLIILQGMSGTGKTSLAVAFGNYLNNTTVVVPIQPMWKERTDLIGYYNEFTKKFNETTLLYKMYEANYNDEIYITVLYEMNVARVEYYFAEFLSLLELPNPEERNLDVVSDKWDNDPLLLKEGKLRLPLNMWFIGTANNDDSTFAISDKVYDRAMVLNLDSKASPFDAPRTSRKKISATYLLKLMENAQKEYSISSRNLRRIKELDEFMIKNFHLTFGNRIMKQIKSYVPVVLSCGGTELDGLDDIFSRKIFRKLESKNLVYVKQMADTLCNYLDELFGVDKLPLCKEAIRNIEQNV